MMIGSWLDVLLVLMLVGGIGLGFHQGLLKQAFLLLAMYIATVLSAQYYGYLSSIFMRAFPSTSLEIADLIAFTVLVVAFTIVVTWLIWTGYRDTKLPAALMLDNMGGAVLGSIIGLFVIALTLMLVNYAVQVPWPEGSSIQFALHTGLSNSALQNVFSTPLPIVEAALRPWLPTDIPFMPNT